MARILTALAAAASAAVLLVPASAWAIDANFLDGQWNGSYSCNGQETYLRLELDGDSDGAVTGSLMFHPFGEEPGPEGSYEVSGEINDARYMELRGSGWIDQPEGALMFDLHGDVDQDGAYAGVVDASACGRFSVKHK